MSLQLQCFNVECATSYISRLEFTRVYCQFVVIIVNQSAAGQRRRRWKTTWRSSSRISSVNFIYPPQGLKPFFLSLGLLGVVDIVCLTQAIGLNDLLPPQGLNAARLAPLHDMGSRCDDDG